MRTFHRLYSRVRFNPTFSLDQQAAQRKKNEKKRLQKQRKASEKEKHDVEREDSIDPFCSDYEDNQDHIGKRSDRQDSGFISDDEGEKICA